MPLPRTSTCPPNLTQPWLLQTCLLRGGLKSLQWMVLKNLPGLSADVRIRLQSPQDASRTSEIWLLSPLAPNPRLCNPTVPAKLVS